MRPSSGNTPDVIEELTAEERADAPYIAKMIMAGSVGLFDAALNYLWNETINRLRDHVAAFDVDYFFDLAETDPARRKNLKARDDLSQIDDYKLLEAQTRSSSSATSASSSSSTSTTCATTRAPRIRTSRS